jgi:hypothetical protein
VKQGCVAGRGRLDAAERESAASRRELADPEQHSLGRTDSHSAANYSRYLGGRGARNVAASWRLHVDSVTERPTLIRPTSPPSLEVAIRELKSSCLRKVRGSHPHSQPLLLVSERFTKRPSFKATCGSVPTTSAVHAPMAACTSDGDSEPRCWGRGLGSLISIRRAMAHRRRDDGGSFFVTGVGSRPLGAFTLSRS